MMNYLAKFFLIIAIAWTIEMAWARPMEESELTKEPDNSPIPKEPDPYWYKPCGNDTGSSDHRQIDGAQLRDVNEEIGSSLKNLRIQHELMLNDYLSRDYEFLYERAKHGIHKHQYIPNWLPGKRETHAVKRLQNTKPEFVSFTYLLFFFGILKVGWNIKV